MVVRVPKFRHRLLARWLVPLLARPEFRVRLDAMGSFVWGQCDGHATVLEIAQRAKQRFGGDAAAVEERVAQFVQRLLRERLVTL